MISYRVSNIRYANDPSGEGGRLNGGRWNHKRAPCIYSSESRALATLEYTVNIDILFIPRTLGITIFEIPDASVFEVHEASLPDNWKEIPAPYSTKDFGTALLASGGALIFKIPSILIPEEFNYIINPMHADVGRVKIIGVNDFVYDMRIKS